MCVENTSFWLGTPSSPILSTWVDIKITHVIKSPLAPPPSILHTVSNPKPDHGKDWELGYYNQRCTSAVTGISLKFSYPHLLTLLLLASSLSLFYPPHYRSMDLKRQTCSRSVVRRIACQLEKMTYHRNCSKPWRNSERCVKGKREGEQGMQSLNSLSCTYNMFMHLLISLPHSYSL